MLSVMAAPSLYSLVHTGPITDAEHIFRSLKPDPYVKDGTRYKAILRCKVRHGGSLEISDHADLYQSDAVNPVHGNMSRKYDTFELTPQISSLIRVFFRERHLGPEDEILVQAQRVVAPPFRTAKPAVEGFHRDDINALGIHCFQKGNVVGGQTILLDLKTRKELFKYTLNPGDSLFLDDTQLLHNTLTIQGMNSCLPAYRDVILLGSPACRPE